MGGAEGCRGHVQVSFIPRGVSLGSGFSFVRWRKNPVLLQTGVSNGQKDGGGFFKKNDLFIWWCQVLAAACSIFALYCGVQDL